MNEENEKGKNRSKQQASLNIPDPAELLKNHGLKRPPSVPILSRRLSSDSANAEDNFIRHSSKPSFKKVRRKSVPDQIDSKVEKIHRKCESKSKILVKVNDSKPPLPKKSSKLVKPEISKALSRDNNSSAPHLRKQKKVIHRIDIPCPVSMTEDRRKTEAHTPSKIIRKLVELKKVKSKELKKIEKEIIQRTSDQPKVLKYEKQIKHHRSENKSVQFIVKKRKKSKTPVFITDDTPGKKVKKVENTERNSNSAQKFKVERLKSPVEKKTKKVKKIRDKGNEAKKTPVKGKKKSKKVQEKWLEHSFCHKNDSFEGDLIKTSEHQSSFVPSTNCNFLSPPVEKSLSKNSSNYSTTNIFNENVKSPPRKVKILKKSDFQRLETIKKEKAAVKIQSWVKGFLTRQKLLKHIQLEKSSFEYDGSFEFDSESENEEFQQIIEEMQKPDFLSFEQEFPELLEEVVDKSDLQAPKPCENHSKNKPSSLNPPLGLNELSRMIQIEQKNLEEVEKSFKEIENLENLEGKKQKKLENDEKSLNDEKKLKSETEKSYPEGEIVEMFKKILNNKYEAIYSMFDDNIKAVKEALANTVISEDSFAVKTEENLSTFPEVHKIDLEPLKLESKLPDLSSNPSNFKLPNHEEKFYKNLEKCSNKLFLLNQKSPESQPARPVSPELIKTFCEFPKSSSLNLSVFQKDPEPVPADFPENQESLNVYGNIFWVDEVAMPNSIDYSCLIIDSVISELQEMVFSEVFEEAFKVDAGFLEVLSEEIIQVLLKNEIEEELVNRKLLLNEDMLFEVIQKVFSKTQGLIIGELLKPLERDPLIVLSEIQETEIGAGFFPDEKYAMLNIEAFKDDLQTDDKYLEIFNSLVFDCINDCLEVLIVKEDLPWALTKYKRVRVRTPEQVVHFIVDRLVKFNEIRAGPVGFVGSENQVARQRDVDAVKIMSSEVDENEELWTRYEKEETQSTLDVADLILESEIEMVIEIIYKTGLY